MKKPGEVLLQKYEIVKPIGQGAEGTVYLARDMHLDRMAAVKERICKKEEGRKDQVQEVILLKGLQHSGLPGVYDFFEEADRKYLVMEYVEGVTLRDHLQKNGRVEVKQAVRWAVELCDVLSYLHSRGQAVIYRDLKPENIMIRPDGTVKLVDFGAAMQETGTRHGQYWQAGTLGYCPGDQWKGAKGDKTWDIYALCAVLHEMLTGKNPVEYGGIRLPVREFDKSIPRQLEGIVEKGLCEEREWRYQTMDELKEALLCYEQNRCGERILWYLKTGSVYGLFLAGAGALLVPLYVGVAANEIPFPFLYRPLFLIGAAIALDRFLRRRKKGFTKSYRQEKSIWYTEKKFLGLYAILLFLAGSVWEGTKNSSCSWQQEAAYAGESENRLWVEMRDDLGRKMLLKEGAVYTPDECVRFEIPAICLPEDEVSIQIVAQGKEGGVYVSRIFLIGKGG